MRLLFRKRKGFTLVELLLVMAIIALLASIVIAAINPQRQLAQARNTQRKANIQTIINAVYQYAIDNRGGMPGNIPSGSANRRPICMFDTAIASCTTATGAGNLGGVNLRMLSGTYLVGMPEDPSIPGALTASGTRYIIYRDAAGRIFVGAPAAELGQTIQTMR
ncbi:MAG: type II secretion system protein [Candidatus Peribacteraceae bacterium]|jgi:type IV pilus assembly protein PilA